MAELNPTTRAGLRLWLGATLAIAMTVWAGRQGTVFLAVMMVVLFVNENDTAPLSNAVLQLVSAVLGVVTGLVITSFAGGWLMLSVGLLTVGLLCRRVGLAGGMGMASLCCWAVILMWHGHAFNPATVVNLALPVVIGVVAAQFATWVVWPRLRRQRLVELDNQLRQRFGQQRLLVLQWLRLDSQSPPPPLRSSEVLPAILQLQQLSTGSSHSLTPTQTRRWAQLGSLWRQVLSQWLVLEAQLQALSAPLPSESMALLVQHLQPLDQASSVRPIVTELSQWRAWAERSGVPPLLALSLAMQLDQLCKLQHSQSLLRQSVLPSSPREA